MKAVVWNGPEEMAVEEIPEPTAEPGTVIVRPEAAGICGSEIEGYLGKMGNRTPPLVMGHEFAGLVTEVGEGVEEDLVGREVAVNPLSSDGTCPLCRSGYANLCPNRRLIGIHSPGGFAEYALAPVQNVYPLPEGVEARTGALAEPLANGVHAVRLGLAGHFVEHAVVVGAGTIGLMCLQAAVLDGIPEVSVVEPHQARREQALELGAHAAYASGEEAREALEGPTEGLGADLVIDAAGAEVTRRMAVEVLLRPGGCAVFVGLHDDETTLGFHDIVRGQLDLRGSYAYTAEDYEQGLDWLVEGRAGIGELPPVLPL
jgi:threonine dehydrogenase-like Zn-dependent dehydrogenase